MMSDPVFGPSSAPRQSNFAMVLAPIAILSVSGDEQSHASLQGVFSQSRWEVVKVANLPAARLALAQKNFSVVVCDCDSIPEPWTELVGHVQSLPLPPAVIITSRVADDSLWSQALNFGAWDVLAKPFRAAEILRSVRYAWERWRNQRRIRPAARATAVG